MLKSVLCTCLFTMLAILICSNQSIAGIVELQIYDGQLTGAKNIYVNGTDYDVEFLDGTPYDIFNGGDGWTFTFTTPLAAYYASTALLTEVFNQESPFKQFDDDPELTNGIESTGPANILTPFQITGLDSYVIGFSDFYNADYGNGVNSSDGQANVSSDLGFELSDNDDYTYAQWSVSDLNGSPVPIPAAAWLLGSGLLGLIGFRRKRSA